MSFFGRSKRGHMRGGGPHLLYLGFPGNGHTPDTTWMAANASTVAASQFDGVIFQLPGQSSLVNATTNITQAAFAANVDPLATANFGVCTHNMPVLYFEDPYMPANLDYTNDTTWNAIVGNWTHLAAACASNPNIVGICLDDEFYGGGWNGSTHPFPVDFRSDLNPAGYNTVDGPGISGAVPWATGRDAAHARGKQLMDAVKAVWPKVRIMLLHGAYISFPETTAELAPMEWNDTSFVHELLAALFSGMVESSAASCYEAAVIDGGEVYQTTTEDECYRLNRWRHKLARTNPGSVIKPSTAAAYRTNNAVGVFDLAFGHNPPVPAEIQDRIARLMRTTDTYVWLYPEASTWDMLGVAGTAASSTIQNAVRDGRLQGKGILPLGGGGGPTTFGRTAVGGSYDQAFANYRAGSQHTTALSWSVTKLSAYLSGLGTGTGDQVCKGVIYAGTAGSAVLGSLLGTSVEVTVVDGSAAGWVDFTFSSAVSLTPGTYWLMIHWGTVHDTARFSWDTSITNGAGYIADTYAGGAATPGGTLSQQNGQYALYATGTSS